MRPFAEPSNQLDLLPLNYLYNTQFEDEEVD